MERRKFIQNTVLGGSALAMNPFPITAGIFSGSKFPVVRTPKEERNFNSEHIEKLITEFRKNVKNEELGWLFNNCFPNTLDTTVTYNEVNGRPDTYVITGDIDAMWLRDSSAQVWPYLKFTDKDENLKKLIAGVINRHTQYILKDPYANAFYDDPQETGYWVKDVTDMQPGIHERKWEIDSLCYPIRLGYHYWKETGDEAPFDEDWRAAIGSILKVFRDQQRKDGQGQYSFMRETVTATDTVPLKGYGYPVNPVGLIASAFRPSDDATVFSFLIPSNFFAVVSLRQAAEMLQAIHGDLNTAGALNSLAYEVEKALKEHAIVEHPKYGDIYAYEVDGFGSRLLMDDANVPSLLGLPYLGAVPTNDPIYQNTRKFVWSLDNPFFFKGSAAEGIGGPHIDVDYVWPMSIIIRGLTSNDAEEIAECIELIRTTHADTGFMHESFHKDNPADFTRSWFAWTNTLFGELLWKTYQERPELLI